MELTKDVYEYLTNFADDKTVLNMLSVNKKFNDPVFFEKIMRRRYPTLIEFKKEYETWKEFYVRTIYWVSLIKEEFNFDPLPYISPDELYNYLKANIAGNMVEESIEKSSKNKDFNSFKKLFERDDINKLDIDFLEDGINYSKEYNFLEGIKYLKQIKR
jgi:hypothetical protein